MKILRIRVKNFKSIETAEENFEMFNTIVGQNNHGKTNLFEAMNWFFTGFSRNETKESLYCRKAPDGQDICAEVEFEGLQNAIAEMSNEKKRAALLKEFEDKDSIIIRRTTEFEKGKTRQLLTPEGEWKNLIGVDSAWNDLLPTLEYVHTKVKLSDIGGYKKSTPIGEMLSGVLSAIIETNQEYLAFKEKFSDLFGSDESEVRVKLNELGTNVQIYLQKQFPDGSSVKFDVENPIFDDLLKNITTEVDDGVPTLAEEKGDGMQRAIMLSIIQVYADYRRNSKAAKKFIFLVDEAELHLHPTAQRALKQALIDISNEGEQVFINTHSSVLVTDHFEGQGVYKAEKFDGRTNISKVGPSERPDIIFELLGGSPADLLLPKNFIIVEGKSDFHFVKRVTERFFPVESRGIQIVFSGGDITEQEKSLHAVHKMFAPIATAANPLYKSKAIIICDQPNSKNKKKYDGFREGYKYLSENEQLHILPVESIEQYYPAPWKKSADEVAQMNGIKEKVRLAIQVGENISLDQLHNEMPKIYNAIQKSFELSFS